MLLKANLRHMGTTGTIGSITQKPKKFIYATCTVQQPAIRERPSRSALCES